jgi:hypothetical protein
MSMTRLVLALAAAGALLAAPAAHAVCTVSSACSAAAFLGRPECCPTNASVCTLDGSVNVVPPSGTLCNFDFGARHVTISGQFNVGSNTANIRAGSVRVAGRINATGTTGGSVSITTTGGAAVAVSLQGGPAPEIDVSGAGSAGDLSVFADGPVVLAAGHIRADGVDPGSFGGSVQIETSAGDITIHGSITVDTDATGVPGSIDLAGPGNFTIGDAGRLTASGGGGGGIVVDVGGAVFVDGGAVIGADALNGSAEDGGDVEIVGGSVRVEGVIQSKGGRDLTGEVGGSSSLVSLTATHGALALVRGTTPAVVAEGAAGGSGGEVTLIAESPSNGAITIDGQISARGFGGLATRPAGGGNVTLLGTSIVVRKRIDATGVGGGGFASVDLDASHGSVTIDSTIAVSDPEDGGAITIRASHDLIVSPGAKLDVKATSNGRGGNIGASAGNILRLDRDATLDGSGAGSGAGGTIVLTARRDLTVGPRSKVDVNSPAANAGTVTLVAGAADAPDLPAPGNLRIEGDVTANGHSPGTVGVGAIALAGCQVTIANSGTVDSTGDAGSTNTIESRQSITIAGRLRASASNRADYVGALPSTPGTVMPNFILTQKQACTAANTPAGCLVPCPACGNGSIQFPEECDPGAANGCTTVPRCDVHCRVQDCDDGNACTTNQCDAVLGCFNEPVADGTICGDQNPCSGRDTCEQGICIVRPPPTCDDLKTCTVDSCDPQTGCVYDPSGCDDGNACTVDDCTDAGGCRNTPIPNCCTAVSDCPGNQGNPCVECVGGECGFRPNCCVIDADCDDAEPCTDDVCAAGTCQHQPAADGSKPAACAERCGECQAGVCADLPCPDGDPADCSEPVCGPGGECTTRPISECCLLDAECDDGDRCTTDTCDTEVRTCRHTLLHPGCRTCTVDIDCDPDGRCAGTQCGAEGICADVPPPDCDDRRPAFSGACVLDGAGAPQCLYRCLTAAACDDGNPCNGAETCSAGTCVPGSGSTCSDGDLCTDDLCDVGTGCRYPAKTGFAGVRCRFETMTAALAAAAPGDLAAPVRKKLTKLIDKARGSVDAAEAVTGKPQKKKLGAARKQLKAIGKTVRAALKKRKVSSALADVLLPAADGGVAAVEALRAP